MVPLAVDGGRKFVYGSDMCLSVAADPHKALE